VPGSRLHIPKRQDGICQPLQNARRRYDVEFVPVRQGIDVAYFKRQAGNLAVQAARFRDQAFIGIQPDHPSAGATASAIPRVIAPVPQPTSSTAIPGERSSARRLCAPRSDRVLRTEFVPSGMCARWRADS